MDQEFFNRIIFATVIFFISIKFVAPLLRIFWESISSSKKNSNNDLDAMIQRKIQLLKGDAPVTSAQLIEKAKEEKASKKKQKNNLSTVLEKIKIEIDDLKDKSELTEKEEQDLLDYQSSVDLLDSYQWGTSEHYGELRKKIYSNWGLSIEKDQFPYFIKKFSNDEVLEMRISENLPHFKEILNVLSQYIFFQLIKERDESLIKSISRKFKTPLSTAYKACCYVILNFKKDPIEDLMKKIIESDPKELLQNDKHAMRDLIYEGPKFFRDTKEILLQIRESSDILSSIEEYDPIDGDLAKAYKLMSLDQKAELTEIKKRYKKLAILKHPDKLTSIGIPDSMMDIANKNFIILKEAYDLIIKSIEAKES